MVRFFPVFNSAKARKRFVVLLAFGWFAGILSGVIVAISADHSFYSLMRMIPVCPVSIVGLLLSAFLPLLFTAVAVYISYVWLLIPVVFLKALCLSLLSSDVCISYGTGGWLAALLLFGSNFLISGILLLLWFRIITGTRVVIRQLASSLLIFLLVGFLDYFHVSPFILNLLFFTKLSNILHNVSLS
jgi:hypothetical protein